MIDTAPQLAKEAQKDAADRDDLRARVRELLQQKRRKPSPQPQAPVLAHRTDPAPEPTKPTVGGEDLVDVALQPANEPQKDAENLDEQRSRGRVLSILQRIVISQNANSSS